jgi:FPC/CPF motif-containing protein YcgG
VAVFVSAYVGPAIAGEKEFERVLWQQLHGLAARDQCPGIDDDELVNRDDPGFVFAGREFFIVGLHPASSRWARRFGWPLLVFNALSHSVPLLRAGKYERMHDRIIERDRCLQGCDNPSLDAPQVAQFSGRAVDDSWSCPAGHGHGRPRP